jgi:serine/threonine protein kinase
MNLYNNRKENYRPLIYDLIDFEQSSLNNLLFEIILSCLSYNPMKRPSTSDLLKQINQLEELFENKSNFRPNSSYMTKQNSYNEETNSMKQLGSYKLKDPYLESIRNRTRIIKYPASQEGIAEQ